MKKAEIDFLIVGAMKAGTSTLAEYCRAHPDIEMLPDETRFFDNPANYQKGVKWYLKKFNYIDNKTIRGEKSATYYCVPGTAERIAHLFPEIKLIWVLRDPVKRLYSHYWHTIKAGRENRHINDCIHDNLFQAQEKPIHNYIQRSLYSEHIKEYQKYFKKDQMKFILFEDLVNDPLQIIKGVYEFLNVDGSYIPKRDLKTNITRLPRSKMVQWILFQLYQKLISYIGPNQIIKIIYTKIKNLLKKKKSGYPPMNDRLKRSLKNYFHSYNIELEKLINIDTKGWN